MNSINVDVTRFVFSVDLWQQLDEMRRDLRWLTDALQFARYKQPRGGVPITSLINARSSPETSQTKTDSTSSNMDYLPTPSPSPEPRHRKTGSGGSKTRAAPTGYPYPIIIQSYSYTASLGGSLS